MKGILTRISLATTVLLGALPLGIIPVAAAQSVPTESQFADRAFYTLWNRTDNLVATGKVARSYFWGPKPNTQGLVEQYVEGPGGQHLVQYFDKSRMEINDPDGDRNNPFFVTNGLLTVELITGRMQLGNRKHASRWPARIPLASDTDDPEAPTYASFTSRLNGFTPDKTGEVVYEAIGKAAANGTTDKFMKYNVKYFHFESATEHNVPDVFWNFLSATGPVLVGGKVATAQLSNPWFYNTGYPITEAFWASVKIAGKPDTDVLIQPYERRVLTYVPSAPEGYKVQMGNIGQHYYDWRYKDAGKPGPLPYPCTLPANFNDRFARLWSSDVVIQYQLHCPAAPPLGDENVTLAVQHFERGHMLYVGLKQNPPRTTTSTRLIYVFLDDATIRTYPDRDPNAPEPTPEPAPPGLVTPVLGFGHVWRTHAEIKPLLGYATGPEKPLKPGEYSFFASGLMFADAGKIYSMFNPEFFYYAYANTWAVYDDPSQ
ncbi:MAG TPA: hypothetical protein VND68_14690 [Chloroflexia bacterium]|nr:hypothetical protein [Chloroflexia bacterium]